MVVNVFAMSCQVSEKPNIGPDTIQPMISRTASVKVHTDPLASETFVATFANRARKGETSTSSAASSTRSSAVTAASRRSLRAMAPDNAGSVPATMPLCG